MSYLSILVATPLGKGGRGGIDRIMDNLRAELAKIAPKDMTVRFATTRGDGSILLSPFYLLAFLAQMTALRLTGRCDLVHINLASRGSTWRKLIVARVAGFLAIPYILHLHGALYQDYLAGCTDAEKERIRDLFMHAALVVVLGTCWQDFVEKAFGVATPKIVVLPNAVSKSVYRERIEANVTRLLFLGELGPRKGTQELIRALACLKDREHWSATLAGNGEVEATRRAIDAAGLSDRVSVPGWVGPEAAEKLLASSDVLVLPSFAENLPMSVIEGMAAGLAVVTTPVGAIPDIIHADDNGILVPAGDVEALAAALARLIADPALRARLGTAARAFHLEHLEIGVYARRLIGIWREASA